MLRLLLCAVLVLPFLRAQVEFAGESVSSVLSNARGESAVLIVFSRNDNEPGRRLDETWQDPALGTWIAQNAVAVHVDPEADREAAAPFALTAYPTTVWLDQDGEEVDRIVGYLPPEVMLAQLEELHRTLPTDHRERLALAMKLHHAGDNKAALRSFVWLWEHGAEHNVGFGGVRVSFFLNRFKDFAGQYPPAREAIEQLRNRCEQHAIGGDLGFAVVSDAVALNGALDTPERNIALYDRIPTNRWKPKDKITRRVLERAVLSALVQQGEYQRAALLLGDPVAALDAELEPMRTMPPKIRKLLVDAALKKTRDWLIALFGAKSDEGAAALFGRLLEIDESVDTWILAMDAAHAAGNDVALHDYGTRALAELDGEHHERIRALLRRKRP